jgi:predicted nucleic acid-binding protein
LIVVDASVVLAFIMHDESEAYADAAVELLLRDGGVVPGNFQSEVSNGLLQAERRQRIDKSRASAALTEILRLPLRVEMPDPHGAMRLARQHHLSCYDSFYLALAMEVDRPLATVDGRLAAAADALRVLWEPA